jgi:hypothetical protein
MERVVDGIEQGYEEKRRQECSTSRIEILEAQNNLIQQP